MSAPGTPKGPTTTPPSPASPQPHQDAPQPLASPQPHADAHQSPASPHSHADAQQPAGTTHPINTQIPFDDDDDVDSAFSDDGSAISSTTSLSASIFEYRFIHGRTYQSSKTTEYWGPNDDRQNNGLDIAHHFVTMLKGDRLFEAPITRQLSKVLDVGTGTGIWAIDMADAHPSAEVIGTDISPIQPMWMPPNCKFFIEDAQLEWTFPPATFDFVHIRALYGSVGDWAELYRQAYRALAPGGWIEDFEFNITLYSDLPDVRDDPEHIFKRWASVFFEGFDDRLGKTVRIGVDGNMRRLMEQAGFVGVVDKTYQVPSGSWSSDPRMKQIGAYNLAFLDESLEGFALYVLKEMMGWEFAEIQLFVMEMRKAIRNPKIRPYYVLTNVYAQKPETGA